ncbi:MAG: flagellin FliC [Deltaproteobacteria bacterium]|nr:flagellin FliC [Deltaproteobacteria bacterium]
MATSLSIVTNSGAMRSNRAVHNSSRAVHEAVNRMSSGLRVQSASDDAAALSTAENMRAQRRGIQQAIRNANDGVSILNTTEATYQSVSDTLVRMRELSVQAASDGLTDAERGHLDQEFQLLIQEIDRMASVAQFNDIQLADGSVPSLTFQVGYRNSGDDQITATLNDLRSAALGVNGQEVDTRAEAQVSIDAIDSAMETLSDDRSVIGSTINRLQAAVSNLMQTDANFGEAVGNARDADIGAESIGFAREQVLQQAGIAMIAQSNSLAQNALRLLN